MVCRSPKKTVPRTDGHDTPATEETEPSWPTEQVQTISVKHEGQEDIDINPSVLRSWEEIASANPETDSACALGTELLLQNSDANVQSFKREYDNTLQWHIPSDKEP